MIDLVQLPTAQWFCCNPDARGAHTGTTFTVKRNPDYIVLTCYDCGAQFIVWTGK